MTTASPKTLGEEVSRLEAQLKRDPTSSDFHRLADAYTRAGRFLDAIRLAREGLKHHPELCDGYVALGRALFASGNLPKAIKALRHAVSLRTRTAEPYRLLGEILLWQSVASEAVTLLETAVEDGIDDRAVLALLERAREAMEREKTGVIDMRPKGIGNRAVAGTISAEGAEGEPFPAEVTRRIAFPEERRGDPADKARKAEETTEDRRPGALRTLPMKVTEATPARPPVSAVKAWPSIDDRWAKELDAHTVEPFPDLESDPSAPSLRRAKVDVPLSSMEHPLAEEAPPVPADSESEEVIIEEEEGGEPAIPAAAPPRPVELVEPPSDIALDKTLAAPQRSAADRAIMDLRGSRDNEPSTPSGQVGSLDFIPAVDPAHTPPPASPAIPGDHLLEVLGVAMAPEGRSDQETSEPEMMPSAQLVEEPPPRPRRRYWLPLLITLLALGGSGGYIAWRYHASTTAGQKALAKAAAARRLDTPEAYRDAVELLSRARGRGGRQTTLAGERDLMAALAWLHYRTGEPPPVQDPRRSWTMALAQATVALAEQAPARARSFVEREPNTNADRALRHLLVAWAAWLEGKRDEADGELTRALALLPDLAAAHLLSGHLSREMGDLEGAQRGYRQALRHSPGHEIAAAALAATLLERDAASTEAEELLGKLGRSPVGQSWRQLLLAERAFRNGEQGSVLGELRAAVSAAPLDPALLFHGVQVLTAAGDYDRARTTLTDRLRKTRASDQDTALFLLEADLEIAQGFELRAVERLRERAPVPRGQRTLALALILLGQYAEAPEVLTGDSSEDARLLRLAAEAATGRKGALLALRDGSRTSRLAKLGLVVALIAQRQPADALPVARELASCPWYRYRALTLMAEAQHLGGDLSAAVASLDAVLRDGASPGFMGARELLGRIYVQTARYEEAAKTLTTVWEKGRRSRDVALALASARALSGKPAEASAMLREAKRLGASAEALDAAAAIIRLAEGKLEDIPDDGDVTYLLALGAARLRTGDSAQAERAWRRALEADPSNPLPYLELGKLHAARRKATALGFFERAIARFKKKPYFPAAVTVEAQLGTARYLLSAGRAGEAIALVKTAMSSETARTAPAYRLLGECHLAQRRYDEARAALERCAGLDVEDATAFYLLGTAARAKPKRARQALQRFLQLEPKGKRAAAARRALRHLP